MPQLTLNYGTGTQHLEVDNHTWRLIKPHPFHTSRLIDTAHGTIVPVTTRGGGAELWILGAKGEALQIGGKPCGISLGLGHQAVLANELTWGQAWLFPKSLFDKRNSNNMSPLASTPHIGQYAVTPVVDPSNLFVGFCVKTSVALGVVRATATLAWVWKADRAGTGYFVIMKTGEGCWGMGVSAGAGVGIFTGMPDRRALENFVQTEASINASVFTGTKTLRHYQQFLQLAERSQRFGEAGRTLRTMSKAKRVFDGKMAGWASFEKSLEGNLRALWSNKGNITQIAATIRQQVEGRLGVDKIITDMGRPEMTLEVAKLIITCLGVDGTKPGFQCIGADAGLELSLSAGYTATNFVWPL